MYLKKIIHWFLYLHGNKPFSVIWIDSQTAKTEVKGKKNKFFFCSQKDGVSNHKALPWEWILGMGALWVTNMRNSVRDSIQIMELRRVTMLARLRLASCNHPYWLPLECVSASWEAHKKFTEINNFLLCDWLKQKR